MENKNRNRLRINRHHLSKLNKTDAKLHLKNKTHSDYASAKTMLKYASHIHSESFVRIDLEHPNPRSVLS